MISSGSAFTPVPCAVAAPAPPFVASYSSSLSSPRFIPGTGGVNPGGFDDTGGTAFDAPIGDALLPLLLFALLYATIRFIRFIHH